MIINQISLDDAFGELTKRLHTALTYCWMHLLPQKDDDHYVSYADHIYLCSLWNILVSTTAAPLPD